MIVDIGTVALIALAVGIGLVWGGVGLIGFGVGALIVAALRR